MLKLLVAKIRQDITVFDVMRQLGDWTGADSTKQVPCKFHGPDRRPSARVYKNTGVMHCFVCANPRYDAIRYVQHSEGLSFKDAVYQIRDWFSVEVKDPGDTVSDDLDSILDDKPQGQNHEFEDVEAWLLRKRGKIPFERYINLSNLFDQIEKASIDGFLQPSRVNQELLSLKERIKKEEEWKRSGYSTNLQASF